MKPEAPAKLEGCAALPPELRGPGVQGCFVTQAGQRVDARFDACGSFSDHSFFWLLFYELIILLMQLSPPPALGYSA